MDQTRLLLLLLLASSPVAAQSPSAPSEPVEAPAAELVPDEAPTEADAVQEAAPAPRRVGSMPGSEAAPAAVARRPPPPPVEDKDYDTELLSLAAMLALWLVTRNYNRRIETPHRVPPKRQEPISPDELARAAFQAARSADLDQYRALFLNGGEASRVFGVDQADSYLSARTLGVLEEGLAVLAARIPAAAMFDAASLDHEGHLMMVVGTPSGQQAQVRVGTVERVGAILRLREPART